MASALEVAKAQKFSEDNKDGNTTGRRGENSVARITQMRFFNFSYLSNLWAQTGLTACKNLYDAGIPPNTKGFALEEARAKTASFAVGPTLEVNSTHFNLKRWPGHVLRILLAKRTSTMKLYGPAYVQC